MFADATGLTPEQCDGLKQLCSELASSISDEASPNPQPHATDYILSKALPEDRASAAACFPIGVLAVKVANTATLAREATSHLVRSTDSVVQMENGTLVFVLQRASESTVLTVLDRIKLAFGSDEAFKYEWAILNELSDRTAGDVSHLVATLSFLGPVSTKLH